MRVIFVQDQEIGCFHGKAYHSKSEHFFERFLCGLQEDDTLTIYTGMKEIADADTVTKQKCVSHSRIQFVKIPEFRRLNNMAAICKKMKRAVHEADFCYLRCGIASSFAGYFCKLYHKPYMTIVNEDVFRSGVNHSKSMVRLSAYPLWFVTRLLVKNADYSCYVTTHYLQDKYPCKGEMLGCSDIEELQIEKQSLKNRYDRIENMRGKVVLGSIGNVATVIKGHDTAIKALAQLKEMGEKNYVYRIVGTGNPDRLKYLAVKMGVSEMIEFLGSYSHDDVLTWFESIDIYLHPSRSEGLPRTILEAMTKATPCICSDVGGISELINSEYLFKYDGNEVKSLSNLILKMNKESMRKEAQRNFEASKAYNPKLLSEKRAAFFEKAINTVRKKHGALL